MEAAAVVAVKNQGNITHQNPSFPFDSVYQSYQRSMSETSSKTAKPT
jgi:hypothetical protein